MAEKKKSTPEETLPIGDSLEEIEKLLKRIGVMYNQYFAGGIKTPPQQLKLQVERMLRDLTKEPLRSSSQRHKFYSLSATYASMQSLWSAKLRERETGVRPGMRSARVTQFSEKRVTTFLRQPSAPAAARPAEPGREPSQLEKLYAKLLDFQTSSGQKLPFQSAEQLGKFLAIQKAKLEQQTGMKGIQLKVAIEDGKLKVKAQYPDPKP